MPTGSCMCGAIKVSYTGEPVFRAICYCNDDRKMSNVQTFQIHKAQFDITHGTPKEWTMISDHGNNITNHFCDTCGTVLFRTGGSEINKDNIGLRAGCLDDQSILDQPPFVEVYVERRPPWIKRVEGAIQMDGKYESVDEESKQMIRVAMEAMQSGKSSS